MKRLFNLMTLLTLLSLACSLTGAPTPTAEMPPIETATQAQVPTEAATVELTVAPATLNDYAIFSITVQDFSYPEQSAAVLDKIISLHEAYNAPVDIYLTDVMAQIYAEQFPQLLERLTPARRSSPPSSTKTTSTAAARKAGRASTST